MPSLSGIADWIKSKLYGYDYSGGSDEKLAVDPTTKALLIKDIGPSIHHTSHESGGGDEINVGGLSGVLADLQHPFLTQGTHANRPAAGTTGRLYFETDTGICFRDNGAAWEERWRLETKTRLAQLAEKSHSSLTNVTASQHHTKTSKLSEITIDVNKDWAGKNITNMGSVEHKGATLKSGIQTEGRCSAYERDADTNMPLAAIHYCYTQFREKMTNTPSSITLSNAAETENWHIKSVAARRITVFGFDFLIESDGASVAFACGSKKYLTVGN